MQSRLSKPEIAQYIPKLTTKMTIFTQPVKSKSITTYVVQFFVWLMVTESEPYN